MVSATLIMGLLGLIPLLVIKRSCDGVLLVRVCVRGKDMLLGVMRRGEILFVLKRLIGDGIASNSEIVQGVRNGFVSLPPPIP